MLPVMIAGSSSLTQTAGSQRSTRSQAAWGSGTPIYGIPCPTPSIMSTTIAPITLIQRAEPIRLEVNSTPSDQTTVDECLQISETLDGRAAANIVPITSSCLISSV